MTLVHIQQPVDAVAICSTCFLSGNLARLHTLVRHAQRTQLVHVTQHSAASCRRAQEATFEGRLACTLCDTAHASLVNGIGNSW